MNTLKQRQHSMKRRAALVVMLFVSGAMPRARGDDYLYVTSAVVGMVRRPVSQGFTLMSSPLRTDLQFGGTFGEALGQPLTGLDAGLGQGADEVYVLQSSGAWRALYLDSQGVWREANGTASDFELAPGQGFYVKRTAEPVELCVTGQVGNDGTRTNLVRTRWNILGPSEGRCLDVKQVFSGLQQVNGSLVGPVGGSDEDKADVIIMQKPDGSWRRLFNIQGWGDPYDGNWFDLSTFTIYTNKVQPGEAFFYFRQPSGGDARLVF